MSEPAGILLEAGTNEVELVELLIGTQRFGVNVAKVREIVRFDAVELIPVPELPDDVVGLFELRNQTIPLIDLRRTLSIASSVMGERRVIVVCEFNGSTNGFLTDGVTRIHRVSWTDFMPLNRFLSQYGPQSTGVVRIDGAEVLILDLERIIGALVPETSLENWSKETDDERDGNDEGTPVDPTLQAQARQSKQDRRAQTGVLICEDSTLIREALYNTFVQAGFRTVESMTNGLEGYERLCQLFQSPAANESSQPPIDLVITDIEMPQMDGLTLCRNIRQQLGLTTLPVLVFSSLINDQMAAKCRQVGATAYVTKPKLGQLVDWADRIAAGEDLTMFG